MRSVRSFLAGLGLALAMPLAGFSLTAGEAAAQSAPWPTVRQPGPAGTPQRTQGFLTSTCTGCVLVGVNMNRYQIRNSDFTGANFAGAIFTYADIRGSTFASANFTDADLSHAKLGAGRYDRAVFVNATANYLVAQDARLGSANFNRSKLAGADFRGAVLRGASFDSAIAESAVFSNADLRESRLRWATFRGADFTSADLRGADLFEANLSGANLAGARNLQQSQLDRACGDSFTRLPQRISIRRCAARTSAQKR